jgi:hypothetical protein
MVERRKSMSDNRDAFLKECESEMRGYLVCCPLCGSDDIRFHLIPNGRDTLTCDSCAALWHLNYREYFRWAELEVEGSSGEGKELLERKLKPTEWLRLAQNARKKPKKTSQENTPQEVTNKDVVREKEIVREKEVIVKVRCLYCKKTYDETLDRCPNCGAS